jgi:hypothetical protein
MRSPWRSISVHAKVVSQFFLGAAKAASQHMEAHRAADFSPGWASMY